jgi:enamine deaminase RidA (YjgF/YER057c/UK114 family)
MIAAMERKHVSSGAKWEDLVGYVATVPGGGHVGDGDAHAQALQIGRNIEWALGQLGVSLADVVRTRIFVTDIRRDWEAVGRAHAQVFGSARPATSMVEVSRLIEDWVLVEIEADAIVRA